MAVIKYDLEDVESGGGEQPKPAVYTVKIAEVNDRRGQDGKNDLEVIVDFFQDEGIARVWSYLNFGESSRWKMREFTDALGLKPKGSLNTDKLIGKKVNVKVTPDQWGGEYRARIGRWLKPGTVEEDGDGDGDAEPDTTSSGNEEDYSDWTLEDLKDEIESRDLEMPSGRKTVEKLVAVLEEADAAGDDAEPDAEEPAEPDDDYDEWPLNELKDEAKERGLNLPEMKSGRGASAANKEAIIEMLREDDAHPFEAE